MSVQLMYRVDIGFEPERGYAALLQQPMPDGQSRQKGIRGNSIEQLVSRLRKVIIEETNKARRFPLEHERGEPSKIIIPENGDPLFGAIP